MKKKSYQHCFVQQCSQRWWQDAELKRAMGDQTQKALQAPLQR